MIFYITKFISALFTAGGHSA